MRDPIASGGPPNALRRLLRVPDESGDVATPTAHWMENVRDAARSHLANKLLVGSGRLATARRPSTAAGPCHGSAARRGSTSRTSTRRRACRMEMPSVQVRRASWGSRPQVAGEPAAPSTRQIARGTRRRCLPTARAASNMTLASAITAAPVQRGEAGPSAQFKGGTRRLGRRQSA